MCLCNNLEIIADVILAFKCNYVSSYHAVAEIRKLFKYKSRPLRKRMARLLSLEYPSGRHRRRPHSVADEDDDVSGLIFIAALTCNCVSQILEALSAPKVEVFHLNWVPA